MHKDRPEMDPDDVFEISAAILTLAHMIIDSGADQRLVAFATTGAAMGLLIDACGPTDAETIMTRMASYSHTAAEFGDTFADTMGNA